MSVLDDQTLILSSEFFSIDLNSFGPGNGPINSDILSTPSWYVSLR